MTIKIDKNIPLPIIESRQYIYSLKTMKYGESFFVKTNKVNDVRISVSKSIKLYKDRTGRSIFIITHIVKGGVRIWKVNKSTKYPYS